MIKLHMPDSFNSRAGWWSATVILAVASAAMWLATNTSFVWATPPQNPLRQGTIPPGACPRTQKYEIENTPVNYAGTWIFNAGLPGDSNGRLSLSSQVGATAAFTFTGVSFDLIVRTDSLGGHATVLIDGVPGPRTGPFAVDFSSPITQFQVLKPISEGLPNGVHTILITVTAPAGRVWLDAYQVGNPALGPADPYEPDNDVSSATPVTFNTTMPGRKLDSNSDQDWISFYVQTGEVLTITTYNLAPGTDTTLTLYATDGSTQLAKSDDVNWPSDLSSRIVYTATVAGTYYVMVAPYPGTGSCLTSYDLSLVKKWKIYLPIILKNHPMSVPTPTRTRTPTTSPPTPGPSPTPTGTSTPAPPCAPVVLGTVTVGNQPRGVAVDTTSPSRNRAYVANYSSNNISVVNTSDNSLVATITGILSPNGIVFDADHSLIWVTNYDNDTVTPIEVVPGDSFRVRTSIAVGDGPWGIDYVGGAVYVANRLGNTATVINAATQVTTTVVGTFSEPTHVAANPVTGKVYVTNFSGNSVTVISAGGASSSVVNIPRSQPYDVAVDSTRNIVYVATVNSNSIVAINGATSAVLGYATFQRGWNPARPVPLRVLAFNPNFGISDGGHLWATTATGDGSEKDQALLIPKGWGSGFNVPLPRDVGLNPREGIDIDLKTNRVYVTSEGSNTLMVLGDNDNLCVIPFSLSESSDEIISVLFKP